jgi:hypothetical protein
MSCETIASSTLARSGDMQRETSGSDDSEASSIDYNIYMDCEFLFTRKERRYRDKQTTTRHTIVGKYNAILLSGAKRMIVKCSAVQCSEVPQNWEAFLRFGTRTKMTRRDTFAFGVSSGTILSE